MTDTDEKHTDTAPDMAMPEGNSAPGDTEAPFWFDKFPETARPFLELARLDRPVGIWLLVIPCWIGLALTAIWLPSIGIGDIAIKLLWALAFLIGAVAMRGAGCTWNDIQDRDIDAKVLRTAGRPLPSGRVDLRKAYLFLAAQIFIGFIIWLFLPRDAKIIALFAIPMVAAYPFMKRFMWWPQVWLGLTFNAGVLIAGALPLGVTFSFSTLLVYLGLVCWTVGYDTIYALQDKEEDALIGVKSTARLFGEKAKMGAFAFYLAATAFLALGAGLAGAERFGALTALAFMLHGIWQIARLGENSAENALSVFKSNIGAGLILVGGFTMAVFI